MLDSLNVLFNEFEGTEFRPFSFFPHTPENRGGGDHYFFWGESYDPLGRDLTYTLQLSSTPYFDPEDLVTNSMGLTEANATVNLASGRYFMRVYAHAGGDIQICGHDHFEESNGNFYKSLRRYDVP